MTKAQIKRPEHSFLSSLLSISKSLRALVGLKLAQHGLHNGQDELLLALDERDLASVSTVADLIGVRPSTVSKMIDRLLAKGLIERQTNNHDARKTMLRITPAGLDVRSKLLNLREAFEAELIAGLSGDTKSKLQAVEEVAAMLKKRLDRLR